MKRLKKKGLVLWDREVFCNDIAWTSDLIGNTGIVKSADTIDEAKKIIDTDENLAVRVDGYDGYWMSPNTADWWDDYVDGLEEADEMEEEMWDMISGEIDAEDAEDDEKIKLRIADYISTKMEGDDMENEQKHRIEAIKAVMEDIKENGCFSL